jgi:hypothetical protein
MLRQLFTLPRRRTAVSDKRLFWISIIVVELVLLYIVWRPHGFRTTRPIHRAAVGTPAVKPPAPVNEPETKPTAAVITPRKSWRASRSNVSGLAKPLVVKTSLKEPEPVAAPGSPLVIQKSTNPRDSFWCSLAMMEGNCDCKVSEERASNLVP